MRKLPTFRGYTVDVRLKEFRKADRKTGVIFIPFDSPKGEQLFAAWLKQPGAIEELSTHGSY